MLRFFLLLIFQNLIFYTLQFFILILLIIIFNPSVRTWHLLIYIYSDFGMGLNYLKVESLKNEEF